MSVSGIWAFVFTAHFFGLTEHPVLRQVTTFIHEQIRVLFKTTAMKNLSMRAALGRSEFIEVEKNVKLHVTDLGKGKPVILIHGWPLSNAMFEYQYSTLIENGYRAIGITMRGFGLSDKPYGRYDYDVFAQDIKVILEELQIDHAVLGGFSFGGATAIRFASKYNNEHVSKLALFGAAAPCEVRKDDFPYGLPIEVLNSLIEMNSVNRPQLIEEFGKLFAASETALPKGIFDWLSRIQFQSSQYAMEQGLYMIRDSDLRADLDKISIPTTIFHGKLDKLCPFELAEQLHKGIANSKLIVFESSGHALFLEERQKFNEELIKFAGDNSFAKDFTPMVTSELIS